VASRLSTAARGETARGDWGAADGDNTSPEGEPGAEVTPRELELNGPNAADEAVLGEKSSVDALDVDRIGDSDAGEKESGPSHESRRKASVCTLSVHKSVLSESITTVRWRVLHCDATAEAVASCRAPTKRATISAWSTISAAADTDKVV